MVILLLLLDRHEDDALEVRWRCVVGSADYERGFPAPGSAVDERAPRAGLRVQGVGDLAQFVLPPEERLERGQVVRQVGRRHRGGGPGVVVGGEALIVRQTF